MYIIKSKTLHNTDIYLSYGEDTYYWSYTQPFLFPTVDNAQKIYKLEEAMGTFPESLLPIEIHEIKTTLITTIKE